MRVLNNTKHFCGHKTEIYMVHTIGTLELGMRAYCVSVSVSVSACVFVEMGSRYPEAHGNEDID